ncbi:MAG: dockerin type I repeat-containing protein, partial [candidate division Zixibacteria bacterium]|nr:dockerin type I repeat-containing protein [candidate division Zixibacteria bacterium]
YCGWNIDDIELMGYVSGSGSTASMEYTPTAMADSLVEGDTTVHDIKIKNVGEADLRVRFIPSVSWITCSSDLLVIPPGDSLDLPVTINATGMLPGDHDGTIDYTANDPANASGSIAVTLHIYAPSISTTPGTITEYVDSTGVSTRELIINNTGLGKLSYGIACETDSGKVGEPFAKQVVEEPLGYRITDPDKNGVEEPYYPEVTKGSGGPDGFGYTWIDSDELGGPTYNWIDISAVGTALTLDDDAYSDPLALGFNFPFYQYQYTEVYLSSNGILTFGGGNSTTANTAIPTTPPPNNMIAMWWDDLDPSDGGNIYYYHDVTGGRFIITFDGVPNYQYPNGTGSLTFQAILYSNGLITLQYGVMNPGADAAGLAGATIGIEDSLGTDGLQVVYNAPYMQDNLAIDFRGATPSWLNVSPTGGTVDPMSIDTVMVQFDALDLPDGQYTGRLRINSNDPMQPVLIVPVTMILGQAPPIPSGDANGDGYINIADVVFLIDYIFNGGPAPVPMEVGDVDCDGAVNIADVTYLVAYIFAGGPPPCVHYPSPQRLQESASPNR